MLIAQALRRDKGASQPRSRSNHAQYGGCWLALKLHVITNFGKLYYIYIKNKNLKESCFPGKKETTTKDKQKQFILYSALPRMYKCPSGHASIKYLYLKWIGNNFTMTGLLDKIGIFLDVLH